MVYFLVNCISRLAVKVPNIRLFTVEYIIKFNCEYSVFLFPCSFINCIVTTCEVLIIKISYHITQLVPTGLCRSKTGNTGDNHIKDTDLRLLLTIKINHLQFSQGEESLGNQTKNNKFNYEQNDGARTT